MNHRSNDDGEKLDNSNSIHQKYVVTKTQIQNSVLYVTNFSRQMSRKKFESLFCPFGRVKDICIFNNSKIAIPYAFVEYDDLRDAVQAKNKLSAMLVDGYLLKVEYKKPKPTSRPIYSHHADPYYQQYPRFQPSPQMKAVPTQQYAYPQQAFHQMDKKNQISGGHISSHPEINMQHQKNYLSPNSQYYPQLAGQQLSYQKQNGGSFNNSINLKNSINPPQISVVRSNQNSSQPKMQQIKHQINIAPPNIVNNDKQQPIIHTNITQNTIIDSNNQKVILASPTISPQKKNEIQTNKPSYTNNLKNDNKSSNKNSLDRENQPINKSHHQHSSSSLSSRSISDTQFSQNSQYSSEHIRKKKQKRENRQRRQKKLRKRKSRSLSSKRKSQKKNRRYEKKQFQQRKRDYDYQRSRSKYSSRDNRKYNDEKDDMYDQRYNQGYGYGSKRRYRVQQNKRNLFQSQRMEDNHFNNSNYLNLNRDPYGYGIPNKEFINNGLNGYNLPMQTHIQPTSWQLQSQITSLYKLFERQACRINQLQTKVDILSNQNRYRSQNYAHNFKDTQGIHADSEKNKR